MPVRMQSNECSRHAPLTLKTLDHNPKPAQGAPPMENMPALLTSTCSGALRLRQRSANAHTERSDARSSCSTCAVGWLRCTSWGTAGQYTLPC